MSRKVPCVRELVVYPLKGAAGTSCSSVAVEPRGLAGDRRWVVVDRDGTFLSQRDSPRLGRVQVRLDDATLTLSAPGVEPVVLGREPRPTPLTVRVWSDVCTALAMDPAAGRWLTAWLKRQSAPVQLAYMPPESLRRVDARYGRPDDTVSFADGFPLLITAQASLDDLNARMSEPLSMRRFRPNLVVDGAPPYAEDTWRQVRIGEVTYRIVKPCARCQVPTLDPDTGTRGTEPLRTLATYRRRTGEVYFGQNAIPDRAGIIRVGEVVEVLDRGPSNLPPR